MSWGRSRALDAAAGDEGKPLAVPKLKGMPGAIPLPPGMSLPPGMAMPPGVCAVWEGEGGLCAPCRL